MLAEATTGPIPDGEMPGTDPSSDHRRLTLELCPVTVSGTDDLPNVGEPSAIRRTSTDNDPQLVVEGSTESTEQRSDHTLDARRESLFDPSQDDTGPQSDQG